MYKVLLVDDEIQASTFLARIMVARGYNVTICADAKCALANVVDEEFDVVLLDIRMPGMDGMEVLRRIRRFNDKVVIIMLSAIWSENSIQEAKTEGADKYLVKPIDTEYLIDKVITSCILIRKEHVNLS